MPGRIDGSGRGDPRIDPGAGLGAIEGGRGEVGAGGGEDGPAAPAARRAARPKSVDLRGLDLASALEAKLGTQAAAAPRPAGVRPAPRPAPFTGGGAGQATTLASAAGRELKVGSALEKLVERIDENAEAGDYSFAGAYKLDPAALRGAMGRPADLKLLAYYAMARPCTDGEDPVREWAPATWDGAFDPSLVKLQSIGTSDALKAMKQATGATGAGSSPERRALERDLKAALDSMLDGPGWEVYKLSWNPNSSIKGVVGMNPATGEVRVLGQFYGG